MTQRGPLWTVVFWQAAAERAIRTSAQTLAAFIGAVPVVLDRSIFEFNWNVAVTVALVSGLLSGLTSIATSAIGTNGPSLGGSEHLEGFSSSPAKEPQEAGG